jgi:hypothetical protein
MSRDMGLFFAAKNEAKNGRSDLASGAFGAQSRIQPFVTQLKRR